MKLCHCIFIPDKSKLTYKIIFNLQIGPVKEYVRMLCDSDNVKFIIFSYHRLMTDGIVEQLIESKVKFIRIDGSTVVQDRPVKFIYSFSDSIYIINYYDIVTSL